MPADEPFGRVIGSAPARGVMLPAGTASHDASCTLPPTAPALNFFASAFIRNIVVSDPTPTTSSASGVKLGSACAGVTAKADMTRAAAAIRPPLRTVFLIRGFPPLPGLRAGRVAPQMRGSIYDKRFGQRDAEQQRDEEQLVMS